MFMAWHGMHYGMVSFMHYSMVWYHPCIMVWYGLIYALWYGMVSFMHYGMVLYGIIHALWYGIVWYHSCIMVWYHSCIMVWYGIIHALWYGMVCILQNNTYNPHFVIWGYRYRHRYIIEEIQIPPHVSNLISRQCSAATNIGAVFELQIERGGAPAVDNNSSIILPM